MKTLAAEERLRYARQLALPQLGRVGQEKLKSARVLCVGAGGLGAPVLLYLAAAGVGTLAIMDEDVIDLSNLQRQVLYTSAEVGRKKAQIAQAKLQQLNPHIKIIVHDERLTRQNAQQIVQNYDVIIDGSDNFATRYALNDACFYAKKPYIYASVLQFQGQCAVFIAKEGPCYRCLYASPPTGGAPNCAEAGVIGALPGLLGSLQALEAIKLITGIGQPLIGKVLTIDALTMQFQTLQLSRHPDCLLCHQQRPFAELPTYHPGACLGTGNEEEKITPAELQALLCQRPEIRLLDVREPIEYQVGHLNATLIPLGDLPHQLHTLDKAQAYVIYCRSDVRSQQALALLKRAGFPTVKYLAGGILAWATDIDPSISVF